MVAELERGDWDHFPELAALRVSKELLRETGLAQRLKVAAVRTQKDRKSSKGARAAAREGLELVQTWREQFRAGSLPCGDTHPAALFRYHTELQFLRAGAARPRRRTILLDVGGKARS